MLRVRGAKSETPVHFFVVFPRLLALLPSISHSGEEFSSDLKGWRQKTVEITY